MADAKEWQEAQLIAPSVYSVTLGTSYLPRRSPPIPNYEEESLVCFVDAAWDSATRNCGFAGVFKGRDQQRYQDFKDSRSHTLVKLINIKGARKEVNNILKDIYYYSSRLRACSFHHISRLCNMEADSVAKSVLALVNSSSLMGG
ncbi:hypothetical protein Bca4012_009100 [Brassica carinata]